MNSASTNLALDPEHRIVEDVVVVVADAVADVDAVVVTVVNAEIVKIAETVATVETAVNVVVVASAE